MTEIKRRVFVPLGGPEPKLLECERCGEYRPPTNFQPDPTSSNGVSGFIRRRYCKYGCKTDAEMETSKAYKAKKTYTYRELVIRIQALEDQNKALEDKLSKLQALIDKAL